MSTNEWVNLLNDLKYKKFYAGSDGFICLVDAMGNEQDIIDAARISYSKGTARVREDGALLRYLMRHRHTSPMEMCELKFLVRCPMDTWRQWIRHRTANVNEYSTRYSEAIDSMAMTAANEWRLQSEINKQGSGGCLPIEIGIVLSEDEQRFHRAARELYQSRLAHGVAREQARKDLPLSNYTEAYWKIDLHNLMHFTKLRYDGHAQSEIREFAEHMYQILKQLYPRVMQAFDDYILNAHTFSAQEMEVLRDMVGTDRPVYLDIEFYRGKLTELGCTKREITAFFKALELE